MNIHQPCNFVKLSSFSNAKHGFLPPFLQYLFQIHKPRAYILRFFTGRNPKRKLEAANNNTGGVCRESSMEEPLIQPIDPYTCYTLHLQGHSDIEAVKQVHGHMLRSGNDQNIFLVTKLVSSYAMSGKMQNARQVFDKICKRDSFLWNVMIREYANNGLCEEAIALYHQMISAGVQPDKFTFPFVLKACAGLPDLKEGQKIHHHIGNTELQSDLFVATALANMYSKCGRLGTAREVFDKISERNVVSWNVMIDGYAQNGDAGEALVLFTQMQLAGLKPDIATMVSVLQACGYLAALEQGKLIHSYIITNGFESYISGGNSLVAMYSKCRDVESARQVFDEMPQRDVVSWNAMISGYAQNGCSNDALAVFSKMGFANMRHDSVTMLNVIQACGQLEVLQQVKWIHGYIIRSCFESDFVVRTALMDMYAKCGSIEIARKLFDNMSNRNVISWSAMIAGYSQNGHANDALALFNQMQWAGMKPDAITMVSVLQACTHLGAIQLGMCVHGYVVRSGFDSDSSVGNSLVDMYAKGGYLRIAHQLFDEMSQRNVVSWCAMISGYCQSGYAKEALTLFHQMLVANVTPNAVTVVSVLPACAIIAALQQGKCIHGYIIKNGFESDVFVGTALIDMYAKCGSVETARHLFDKMSKRDVVLWSAMIAGYGMHGFGEDALALFSQMRETGIKPNHVTFICVLYACSHAGLVDEGWKYFDCMVQDYHIMPRMEHYVCMVDLLGRSGHLEKAEEFIKNMPLEPSSTIWGALLGGCRIHGNIELAERVAELIFELDPGNAGCYVLLSNIYAAAGRWDGVAKVRTTMSEKGVKKTPGCTLIEINNKVHSFFVGDSTHPQSENIYTMLEILDGQMKEAGYVPDINFVLHDVEEEVKEHMLSTHSEKLAIAFGILNTKAGTCIRITKNLRVCTDCHNATKFISKILRREILVRDANRFHRFKEGLCSCKDYW